MSRMKLDICWPRGMSQAVYETRFSYDFCRRKSVQVSDQLDLAVTWHDYTPGTCVELQDIHSDMLLVTDSELVLSAPAVERLAGLLAQGCQLCGPVFNYTDYPLQAAQMAAPYLNLATFFEVAGLLSAHAPEAVVAARQLDPACIAINKNIFQEIEWRTLLANPPVFLPDANPNPLKMVVDTGALVHRFGPYYFGGREDLIQLIPNESERVLDVGCAFGGYGKQLKKHRPDIHLTGVEMNPVMAAHARTWYDRIVVGLMEDVDLAGDFDWINCGDVLEHCQDPWKMLARLHDLLRAGGGLLVSVPNAGHWTLVKDLLAGNFDYIPVGLQCITHLRWFTEASLRDALLNAGFSIDSLIKQKMPPTPEGLRFIRSLCDFKYGNEESLTTNQMIVKALRV